MIFATRHYNSQYYYEKLTDYQHQFAGLRAFKQAKLDSSQFPNDTTTNLRVSQMPDKLLDDARQAL